MKDAEARETANAALPAEDYTAEDILEKLKTVDGAGSGLDADLFKGQSVVPVANGGTGNTTGNAPSAAKLATARTVRTNLASTSAASFNGTANITPGVSGVLPIANGGTGASTASAAFKALAADYGYGGTKSMGAADFNDLAATGFYSVIFSSGTDQSPYHTPLGNATNTSWYHVIVMTPENRIRQVAFFGYAGLSASGKCWTRYKHDSNWSDWVEIMTSDNIQYSTTDLTAGTSALANGDIYLVYE